MLLPFVGVTVPAIGDSNAGKWKFLLKWMKLAGKRLERWGMQ